MHSSVKINFRILPGLNLNEVIDDIVTLASKFQNSENLIEHTKKETLSRIKKISRKLKTKGTMFFKKKYR